MTAPTVPRPAGWTERAACVDHDPRLWDEVEGNHRGGEARHRLTMRLNRAFTICRGCPVLSLCALAAIDPVDQHPTRGVWAGRYWRAGKAMAVADALNLRDDT